MERNELATAVAEGLSIRQLQKRLGACNGSVRYWLKKYGMKTNGVITARDWSKEGVIVAMVGAVSMSDVLRKMGLTIRAGNYQRLQKYAKRYGITLPISQGGNGTGGWFSTLTDDDVFVENSLTTRHVVKKRLRKEGRGHVCEICEQGDEWFGKPLVMVLDHENGVNDDNRKGNLRFLCPNCNSTLSTHCGRNIKQKPRPIGPGVLQGYIA